MVPLVILKVAPYGKHASIKSVSLSLIDYRAHTHIIGLDSIIQCKIHSIVVLLLFIFNIIYVISVHTCAETKGEFLVSA